MKYILSALAAVTLLVGIGASQPAEARCFWKRLWLGVRPPRWCLVVASPSSLAALGLVLIQ